ncbi:MAG TPA: hypothetical protein VFF12_00880 [Myxococcaceae bacterium]|nr:hypothetical protein [Myxococcaceae bacterium]
MSEGLPGDLPEEWEDLGRADASELAPPPGAKDRVQRRVALTLGLGAGFLAATAGGSSAAAAGLTGAGAAGSAGATGGGTGAAATGIAGSLLAKKLLVVGVLAAVGVGGGTAAYLEVRSERARSHAPVVTPTPRTATAPVARPVAPPLPEPPPAEAPVDTLGEERGLLDRARQDIARGMLAEARALLDRHAAEFPSGQLAEEREALVIRLLVREGRLSEARSRAARFRMQHPRSIQLPGIDDALRERR